MILEATRKKPKIDIIEIEARLVLFLIDAWIWSVFNWPKVQVYALTRYDLARRRISRRLTPCPVAMTFILLVGLFVWLHYAYNLAEFLIGRGLCSV